MSILPESTSLELQLAGLEAKRDKELLGRNQRLRVTSGPSNRLNAGSILSRYKQQLRNTSKSRQKLRNRAFAKRLVRGISSAGGKKNGRIIRKEEQ